MNIPIVGQTFEIDGYKSIECTADPNADAKAFAKANGIPVAEAKYILETLYGSARRDKDTEGVTDTTADEDAEVDASDDDITAAIDNLTAALEGNDNVNKDVVAQITELLKKLTGSTDTTTNETDGTNATNTTNNANTNTADIDWTALEVEGKGINVNNLANKTNADIFKVAKYDSDGDGFLSDTEYENYKAGVIPNGKRVSGKTARGYKINEVVPESGIVSTTVNGKKVYWIQEKEIGTYIALTEDEYNVMSQYFNSENIKDYVGRGRSGKTIKPIIEEMGGTVDEEARVATLVNAAGIETEWFTNDACGRCDERLFQVYRDLRDAIAADKAAAAS